MFDELHGLDYWAPAEPPNASEPKNDPETKHILAPRRFKWRYRKADAEGNRDWGYGVQRADGGHTTWMHDGTYVQFDHVWNYEIVEWLDRPMFQARPQQWDEIDRRLESMLNAMFITPDEKAIIGTIRKVIPRIREEVYLPVSP